MKMKNKTEKQMHLFEMINIGGAHSLKGIPTMHALNIEHREFKIKYLRAERLSSDYVSRGELLFVKSEDLCIWLNACHLLDSSS